MGEEMNKDEKLKDVLRKIADRRANVADKVESDSEPKSEQELRDLITGYEEKMVEKMDEGIGSDIEKE